MSVATTANVRPRRRFARPVPVSVNGVAIASADIVRETQHHPSSDPDQAWEMASRALAIRELLSQEADRLGIVAEPIEDEEGRAETGQEARYRQLIEREVVVPSADEQTCRRYYARNIARFRTPDLSEAAHILLPAAPGDAAARAQARETARRLIEALCARPQDFAVMAAQHSACPSAGQGGNLGQLSPGQTAPEFDAALRTMLPGTIHAEPVESRYGFHVVRLDRRIEGRELPFEMVRARIAEYLDESVRRRALQQYVSVLAGRAVVTGVDLAPAAGPLLQ
ncbi:MAG: peptidylprolyl isomerase [Alphaproteobacteria bacterium]|nr:peptidylprolyl isomerase [Alphaproteobacteria bacterium]MCW5739085.1 peptidylprolyl isomerase [Alphaproteobacteria bacterium]